MMRGHGDPRQRAWRLIYAAKKTTNPTLRRMLMAEAFELAQQSEIPPEAQSPGASARLLGAKPYRVCFRRDDRVAFWIDLEAESMTEAAWIVAQLRPICAHEHPEIELWRGGDCILGNDPTQPLASLEGSAGVSAASQRRLLETEEAPLNSRQAIAQSRKLLAATARLRLALACQGGA